MRNIFEEGFPEFPEQADGHPDEGLSHMQAFPETGGNIPDFEVPQGPPEEVEVEEEAEEEETEEEEAEEEEAEEEETEEEEAEEEEAEEEEAEEEEEDDDDGETGPPEDHETGPPEDVETGPPEDQETGKPESMPEQAEGHLPEGFGDEFDLEGDTLEFSHGFDGLPEQANEMAVEATENEPNGPPDDVTTGQPEGMPEQAMDALGHMPDMPVDVPPAA